jgi:quinol monooxygenase YgiN
MPSETEQTEVRIVAEITAKAGQADALRAVLLAMLPPSRAEAGCLSYALHEDRAAVGHFMFIERWVDAAAFAFHCGTPHFQQLGPAIKDLVAAAPSITQLRLIG